MCGVLYGQGVTATLESVNNHEALAIIGKNLGVVDGYLEKREKRKEKERGPPKAAFYQCEKMTERSKQQALF